MPEPDVLLVVGADLTQLNQQIAAIRQTMGSQIFNIPTAPLEQSIRAQETLLRQAEQGFRSLASNASRSVSQVAAAQTSLNTQIQQTIRNQARMDSALNTTFGRISALTELQRNLARLPLHSPEAIAQSRILSEQIDRQLRSLNPTLAVTNELKRSYDRLAASSTAFTQGLVTQQNFQDRLSVTWSRAIAENERFNKATQTQLSNQQRQLSSMVNQLGQFHFFAPSEIAKFDQIKAGLEKVSNNSRLTTVEMANLRKSFSELMAVGRASVGVFDDMGFRFINLAKYAANAVVIFATFDVLRNVVKNFVDTDSALTQLSATMQDVNERAVVMPEALNLMRHAQREMGLSASESGTLIKELGKAMGDNVALMRASYLPSLLLISSGEANHQEAVQRVVGIYNIFGDTLRGAATEQEKQVKIWDAMSAVSFATVGNVNTLAEGVQFSGRRAAAAGVSFQELISILGVFQNQLTRAGRSGQEASRLFEAVVADPNKFARAFDLPEIDISKPLALFNLLRDMGRQVVSQGQLSARQLANLQQLFPLEHAERAFTGLFLGLSELDRILGIATNSAGSMGYALQTISNQASVAASALMQTFYIGIYQTIEALTGLEGKQDGVAALFRYLQVGAMGSMAIIGGLVSVVGSLGDAIISTAAAAAQAATFDFHGATQTMARLDERMKNRADVVGKSFEEAYQGYLRLYGLAPPNSVTELPPETRASKERRQFRQGLVDDLGPSIHPDNIPRILQGEDANVIRARIRSEIAREALGKDKSASFEDRLRAINAEIANEESKAKAAFQSISSGGTGPDRNKAEAELRRAEADVQKKRDARDALFREESARQFKHHQAMEKAGMEHGNRLLEIDRAIASARLALTGTEDEKEIAAINDRYRQRYEALTKGIEDEEKLLAIDADLQALRDEEFRQLDIKRTQEFIKNVTEQHNAFEKATLSEQDLAVRAYREMFQTQDTFFKANILNWEMSADGIAANSLALDSMIDKFLGTEKINNELRASAFTMNMIGEEATKNSIALSEFGKTWTELADSADPALRKLAAGIERYARAVELQKTDKLARDVRALEFELKGAASAQGLFGAEALMAAESFRRFERSLADLNPTQRQLIEQWAQMTIQLREMADRDALIKVGVDPGSASEIAAVVGKVNEYTSAQQQAIKALETYNRAQQIMQENALHLWEETARGVAQFADGFIDSTKSAVEYFIASMTRASIAGKGFLDGIQRLGQDTARALNSTLSDVFFDAFNNNLKDAGEYWDAFLGSLKRSAANFLADQTIRTLFEIGKNIIQSVSSGGEIAVSIGDAIKKAIGLGGGGNENPLKDLFSGGCVPVCGGVGGATGGHTAGTPIPSSSVPGGITSWLNNLFFTPDHTRNPAIEDAFQDQRAGERDPTGAGSLLGTDSVQQIADSISFPIWSQDTFSGSDGGFFPQSDVPLTFDSNPITFENPTVNFDFDSFDWSGWDVPVSGLVAQDGIDFASILNDEAALRSLVESANAENLFASDLSRMLASGGSVASDVPVTVGTTSTQPTSGSAVNLSLGSTVGALGSAYSLFNILSGDAFGNDVATTIKALSNLNTLLSTAAKTAPSLLGELNPRVPGTNLTAASSTGALLNAALGAYQLSQGNYISGAGGLVSGAGTIASGIPALSGVAGLAGPIGLALQIAGLFSGDMTGSQRTLAIGQLATNLIIPQLASALLASAAAGGAAGVAAGATAAGGLSSLGSALLSTLTGGLIGGTAGAATGAAVGATAGTAVAGTAAGTAAAGTAAAGATAGATAGLAAAAPVLGVALPIAAWAYGLFLAIEQNTRGDYVPTRQKEAADLGRNIPEAARWIQATRTMEELNQFLHMLSLTEGNFISGKWVRDEQSGEIIGTHLEAAGAVKDYLNAVIDRQRQLIMAAEAGNLQAIEIINRAIDFKEDANLLYNVAPGLVSQVGEQPPVMNAEELGNRLRSLSPEQLNDLAGNASTVGKADARVTSVDEIQDLIRKYANLEIQEITSPWRLMDPENASGVNREFLISDISPQMRLEEVNQQISQLEALMAVLLLDPNALPTEQIQQLPNIIDALKQSVNQTTESLSRYATSQTVFYSNKDETLQQVSQPPLSLYGTQAEVENMVRAYAEQGFQLTDISPQWIDAENQQSRWDFLVTPITPQAQVQAQAEANERLAQLETLLSILLLGNPGSSLPGLIAAASSLAPDTSLAAQAQAQETQQASVSGMVTLPTGTGILAPDAQQQFVEKLISATTPVILDPEMQKQLVEELSKYMPAWSDEKISEELLKHLAANSAIAGMVSPQQIMQQQQTGTLVPTVSPTILTSPTVTSTTATAPTTTTSTTITPTTPYYFGTVTNPYYIPEWYDIRSFDGFSEGGLVGIGMTGQRGLLDTVPAWLQPGEIVIRKDIADQYRDPLLSLNAGIPMSPIGEMRGASGFSVGQINIHVEGGSNPQETARAIRDELMRALRNLDDDTNERMMHNMGRTDRKKNMKMFGGTGAQSRLMGNFSG